MFILGTRTTHNLALQYKIPNVHKESAFNLSVVIEIKSILFVGVSKDPPVVCTMCLV